MNRLALRDSLGHAARRLARAFWEPQLPLLAVEVRPRALGAVRLVSERGRLALGAAAAAELPAGILEPSLTRPNIVDGEAFRSCLRTVLERVGALAAGPVSLVLPDPCVRVTVVEGGVRGRARDLREAVRFRLHKALPFDVRTARLAWNAVAGDQIAVAVAPDEVVAGYEDALETLGYEPGLVVTAGMALADGAVPQETPGDRLIVNWDFGYVSFLLVRGGELLLVRTLPGEDTADAVVRQAAGTLQFHADRLGGAPIGEVWLRSAALPGEVACGVLEPVLGQRPRLVAPWAALGVDEAGEAAQAVAGAAFCVLRRAA